MSARAIRKPGSEAEWLAIRKPYVGGSEIAAILGLSPWRTPVQLFLEKTGRLVSTPSNTEALRLGQYLEQYAAMRYQEETGRTVRNYNYMLVDEDSLLCGDIDRLVVPAGANIASFHDEIRTDTLLECKTSGVPWDDGVPPYYEAQVQQYLGLSGCIVADFAVVFLAPRREFRMFSVRREDDTIAAMREQARIWIERYVKTDTPPPAVCEADCKALWAKSRGIEISAAPDVVDAIEQLRAVEAEIKGLEKQESDLKSGVMAFLGEADTLLGPDGRKLATWKSAKDRETVDWAAAFAALVQRAGLGASDVDEIVAAHTSTKPGARTFRLAARKEAAA